MKNKTCKWTMLEIIFYSYCPKECQPESCVCKQKPSLPTDNQTPCEEKENLLRGIAGFYDEDNIEDNIRKHQILYHTPTKIIKLNTLLWVLNNVQILSPLVELENEGKDCWIECHGLQGPCAWCGSKGFCCTKKTDWTDTSNGCDGSFGGETRHECALPSG